MCKCNCENKSKTIMKFKKVSEHAVIPEYAKKGDAGADLRSVNNITINPGCVSLVDTGLQLEMPIGWQADVYSRSGLAIKKQIFVLNAPGLIDSGYRNNIGVIIQNLGKEPFVVNIGDRIAQIVFKQCPEVLVTEAKELSDSERGKSGLGSTGVK